MGGLAGPPPCTWCPRGNHFWAFFWREFDPKLTPPQSESYEPLGVPGWVGGDPPSKKKSLAWTSHWPSIELRGQASADETSTSAAPLQDWTGVQVGAEAPPTPSQATTVFLGAFFTRLAATQCPISFC